MTELGFFEGKRYAYNEKTGLVVESIPAVRECMRPGPGRKLVLADYSQIELRIIAFLSQEDVWMDAIKAGKDLHCVMTSLVYPVSYADLEAVVVHKDKKHPKYQLWSHLRAGIKCVNFGIPYGAGPQNVAGNIQEKDEDGNITEPFDHALARAKELIKNYFAAAPKLELWLKEERILALAEGWTASAEGRKRFYDLPDQHDPQRNQILSQIGRFAGNQPIQCVAGSTRVFEKSTGYVPIETLVGREVTVWDGTQWAKASVAAGGAKRLMRVQLMNGLVLECSPEHKLLIRTPKVERWMTVRELQTALSTHLRKTSKNYRVVLSGEVPEWNFALNMPDAPETRVHNARTASLTDITDMRELGLFLGRVASDGCVTPKPGNQGAIVDLMVAEHEKQVLPILEQICSHFGTYQLATVMKEGYENPVYHIRVCVTSLAKQIHALGIKGSIPDCILTDRTLLSSYLCGLFDGDGGMHPDGAVLTFGGGDRHLEWGRQVQQALLLFGIRSRLRCYPTGNGVNDNGSVRLQIQKYDMPIFCKEIGFINPIKQAKAEKVVGQAIKGTAAYGTAISIRSIEDTGVDIPMFDVVNSTTERFMANGMVVHNSSSADMLKYGLVNLYLAHRGGSWTARKVLDANILLVCHDEIVTDAAIKDVPRAVDMLEIAMSQAYDKVNMTKIDAQGNEQTFYMKDLASAEELRTGRKVDGIVADYWSKD